MALRTGPRLPRYCPPLGTDPVSKIGRNGPGVRVSWHRPDTKSRWFSVQFACLGVLTPTATTPSNKKVMVRPDIAESVNRS